jgi:hypothetical protein
MPYLSKIDQDSFDQTIEIARKITDLADDDIAWMLLCVVERGTCPEDHARYIGMHDLYNVIQQKNRLLMRSLWLTLLGILLGVIIAVYVLQ